MAGEPTSSPDGSKKVPVLLLKTKSSPTDAYEELFSAPRAGFHFEPAFVPVLQHCFVEESLSRLSQLLREKRINRGANNEYGGLIFTSQRAVEAFAKVVGEGQGRDESWPHLQDVPIYSVGPATTRALRAIPQSPPLRIFGEHTGTGDVLAQYILEHYGEWYRDRPTKPPLLFLVGEQRRDIIPKTLTDPALPANTLIGVDEMIVYGTGVMISFPRDFENILSSTSDEPRRWVVVFSPTGCDSMLRGLGFVLDEKTGRATRGSNQRNARIATIGPTTRDYLIKTFMLEPDVCAAKPSPEGVWEAITQFDHATDR
ncbi:uroporphyrinogen-III synthase [Nemania sp. FL0916]|nr:uroporphyrinogen-III synthase [Nemania sp. FL0916]